jgi:hypothetical protein
MSVPAPRAATEPETPLRITVDGQGVAACVDALLAVPTPVTVVEVMAVRSIGQSGDYVWLGFVTHHPSRGWERNGLAAEAPGMGAGRRMVVDLRDLAAAVHAWAPGRERRFALEWYGDRLVIGDRAVAASDAVVPPVPEVPTVRDAVYLAGPAVADVVVESEEGRIAIPQPLVAHLLQRGAHIVELGVVAGEVFVVAQSERRGEASTDPVIVAPVPVLMWSDTSVHAEFRERRRRGGSEVEQLLAALDPATPVPVLLELLDTGVAYVRRRVAAHPSLPVAVTDALAATGTRPIRVAVAANPSLSPIAVEVLARDPDATVRAVLASNPVLTPAVHGRLARDRAVEVRVAVAGDPAAEPDLVRRLAHDRDPAVRRSAATNPACPREVLEALVDDLPDAVLGNPSVPEHLLVEGSRTIDGAVRAVVAANPSTPGRVLVALSRDPDLRVLRAVAANPNAPAPARRRAEKRVMTDGEPIGAHAPSGL